LAVKNPIGSPFIELLKVESTNNYAMGLVYAGMAQHGTAVFTKDQTKGKGQRDKQWESEAGKNLALSIVVEPKGLATSQFFLISMAAAVAAYRVFSFYAGDETRIKWPNDIYWRDRKAAGILIENVVQANEWKFSVVGIGCNVNQVSFGDLQQAVSLKQVTGKDFEPAFIAKEICSQLNSLWDELCTAPGKIASAYLEKLYKLDQKVKFKKDNRSFEAVVKGVNLNGQLIVEHAFEERFDVGQVEWVIGG
jgi:BirA family transcriptional regulator, biotin operon repressor / biotin---[acetyl-CoA-carboxylase] ligase